MSQSQHLTPNQAKAANQATPPPFVGQMLQTLNQASLALMISLGHRSGLFDIMAEMEPSTSETIAEQAGLNERYVREWLGTMVTGGVIEYQAKDHTYHLPEEHAGFLTRRSDVNLASFLQFIPLLGSVEDGILECFRHGGGLPYQAYPHFHEVMAEVSGQTVVAPLIEHLLPIVPGLTQKLESGIRVLDVGCGLGQALMRMAEQFPKSQFVGYDLCSDAINMARQEATQRGLHNVHFEVRNLTEWDENPVYDLVTAFDVIHDQARPDHVLHAIGHALKPNGLFFMQDIKGSSKLENNLNHPIAPFGYTVSCMHCMSVSLSSGGMGLGTMWGREKAMEMLHQAGFEDVHVHELPHDFMNDYYVARLH